MSRIPPIPIFIFKCAEDLSLRIWRCRLFVALLNLRLTFKQKPWRSLVGAGLLVGSKRWMRYYSGCY
jgi:hypothetical protein